MTDAAENTAGKKGLLAGRLDAEALRSVVFVARQQLAQARQVHRRRLEAKAPDMHLVARQLAGGWHAAHGTGAPGVD